MDTVCCMSNTPKDPATKASRRVHGYLALVDMYQSALEEEGSFERYTFDGEQPFVVHTSWWDGSFVINPGEPFSVDMASENEYYYIFLPHSKSALRLPSMETARLLSLSKKEGN